MPVELCFISTNSLLRSNLKEFKSYNRVTSTRSKKLREKKKKKKKKSDQNENKKMKEQLIITCKFQA